MLRRNGKRIAIEIESGKSDAVYNIKKNLIAGFDVVISVALNNKIEEKIMVELKKSELDKEKL